MRFRLLVLACVVGAVATTAIGLAAARQGPRRATTLSARRVAGAAFEPPPVIVPVAAPVTTAPPPPPPPPATTTTAEVIPTSRTVFIVGDSLTQGAEPWLPDMLRAFHWGATGVDAVHGRKTVDGIAALAANRTRLPPTVLVALGTNDLNATPADIDAWVKQTRALVGNRRLIWVNLHLSDAPQFANYRTLNAALADAARRYHVELADWAGWSTAVGVRHLGDGVHYPAPGYQRRAEFYARVLAAHR